MTEILRSELKKSFTKAFIIILILFILIGLLINGIAITKYKNEIAEKTKFVNVENQKVERYFSYLQYEVFGFRMLFVPSPLSSLFSNSSTLENIYATIDSGFNLDLNKKETGKYLFKNPTGKNLDFSWFLMITGSIFSIFLGWSAPRNREYSKLLLYYRSKFSVYSAILLSRVTLIFFSLFTLTISLLCQYAYCGISFNYGETSFIIIYMLIAAVLMAFFLMVSFILGTIENVFKGGVIGFFLWLILLFILPEFHNLLFFANSEKGITSTYDHELEKINVVVEFEKRSMDYLREKGNSKEARIELYREYLDNEAKRIEALEAKMVDTIRKNAKKYHLWSIINPVVFYRSVNNELSGCGFSSFLELYKISSEKKRGFIEYNFQKRFHQNGKVKPYVSDDGYLYFGKPGKPDYFGLGVLVQLAYIVVLFMIGYFRFNRVMFPREKKAVFSNLDLKLENGNHYVFNYREYDRTFPDFLFSLFMGKAGGFSGKITINGQSIVNPERKNFVYLPSPDALPGNLKVKAVLCLLSALLKLSKPDREALKGEYETVIKKRFGAIKEVEKVNLMLRMAEFVKPEIYLMNNFFVNIRPPQIITGIKKKILKEDTLIIVLSSRDVPPENPDHYSTIDLGDNLKYEEWIIRD